MVWSVISLEDELETPVTWSESTCSLARRRVIWRCKLTEHRGHKILKCPPVQLWHLTNGIMRPVLLLRHLHFVEMECIHLAVLEMQQIIIGEKHSFSDKNKFLSLKNITLLPNQYQGREKTFNTDKIFFWIWNRAHSGSTSHHYRRL